MAVVVAIWVGKLVLVLMVVGEEGMGIWVVWAGVIIVGIIVVGIVKVLMVGLCIAVIGVEMVEL
jgi:hypothetical protein